MSKRISSVSHKSQQLPRFTRYARATTQSVRVEEYKIRKSLCDYVTEELDQQCRQLFFQRVTILAKNVKDETPEPSKDFFSHFQQLLDTIVEICNLQTFTTDDLSGLFLCIGDYTLLVVESAEDMMGYFLEELAKYVEKIWQASRVFMVEDKIDTAYFQNFSSRRTVAININEKFPTATPNDEDLMGVQHWKIKRKLDALYNEFYKYSKDPEGVEGNKELPNDELYKLLPEVQRIDLVLNSHFYRTVESFASIYDYIPMPKDEDSVIWPVPYNYTPLAVFQRSPYDVNLTFTDYGKEEAQARLSSIRESKVEAAEEVTEDKKETAEVPA